MNKKSRPFLPTFAFAMSLAVVAAGPACTPKTSNGTGGAGTTGNAGAAGATGAGTGLAGTTGSATGVAGTTGSGTGAAGTTGSGTGVAGTTGSGTGVSGATGSGTGVAGTTGSGTGTAGTTGTGGAPPRKLCAVKATPASTKLLNFEGYNGMVAPDMYAEAFGTISPTEQGYAGTFGYGDGTATPTLAILGGRPPSTWAVSQEVTQASMWGMGGGVWMACADASAYRGISLWVRGSSPTGVFTITLDMESTRLPDGMNALAGGTCPGTDATCKPATKANIPLTADWTEVQILWADFAPGMSGTTAVVPNGNNIVGIGWSVPLMYQPDPASPDAGTYIAVPGDLTINIDDISFIP